MATGTKNFSYHSARIWNTIASKISINVSLSQFKATLKNCLLHNPFVYIPTQNNLNVLANNIHYPP